MEQRIERQWKSIVCPDGKEESLIMCEWEIVSKEGNILKRNLKQIDCHNPRLAEFEGKDCSWRCERSIEKQEITRSGMEWLWVSCILGVGILWIAFYDVFVRPYLHLYGLLLFVGIPLSIGLMLYSTWKMMRHTGILRGREV